MSQTNLLQKLVPVGVVAFSAISVIGITTVPAQASTLGWSNGTSDFFSDVNPGEGDTFTVIFSPDVTADPPDDGIGAASVDNADGAFLQAFQPAPPIYLQDLTPAVGNFVYSPDQSLAGVNEFIYELEDDLVFEFLNEDEDVIAVATVEEGTQFVGFFDTDDSVEFALAPEQGQAITVEGIDFGDETFLDDGLEFEDGSLPAGGEYLAEVEYSSVPEPTTFFGLLTVGGLGLGLKRKKQL